MKIFQIFILLCLCSMNEFLESQQQELVQAEDKTRSASHQVEGVVSSLEEKNLQGGVVDGKFIINATSDIGLSTQNGNAYLVTESGLVGMYTDEGDVFVQTAKGNLLLGADDGDVSVTVNGGDIDLFTTDDFKITTYGEILWNAHDTRININLFKFILSMILKTAPIFQGTFTNSSTFDDNGQVNAVMFDGEYFSLTIDKNEGSLDVFASNSIINGEYADRIYLGDGSTLSLVTSTPETATIVWSTDGNIIVSGTV